MLGAGERLDVLQGVAARLDKCQPGIGATDIAYQSKAMGGVAGHRPASFLCVSASGE